MSNKTMFFGTLYDTQLPGSSSTTANAKMSYVPVPDPGMNAGATGFSELLEFENGGADVVASAATHRNFEMDWNLREASGANGLNMIKRYQQKAYGPGLIYFADPMNYKTNMFAPAFATPGLIEQGWKGVAAAAYTFSSTGSNAYNLPMRKASTTAGGPVGTTAPVAVPNAIQVLPIPSDHVMWMMFRGTAASGNVFYARPINLDGSYASVTGMQLNGPLPGSQVQYSFSGATYKAVEVWASYPFDWAWSLAQLHPIGVTPSLTTLDYIPGEGHTGCKFGSDAIVESYILHDRNGTPRSYKGMSVDLIEAGAWQRSGT